MIRRSPGMVALVFALSVAVSGCTTTKTIDTPRLESQVKSFVAGQGERVTTADCPEDVPARAGYEFECTVRGPAGSMWRVTVTERDDRGNVELRLRMSGAHATP
jgi:hypothetical protein